jgi:hypothetical protein
MQSLLVLVVVAVVCGASVPISSNFTETDVIPSISVDNPSVALVYQNTIANASIWFEYVPNSPTTPSVMCSDIESVGRVGGQVSDHGHWRNAGSVPDVLVVLSGF